ncbi:trypsin-like serine protease [Mycolicibacterium sp. Y3]
MSTASPEEYVQPLRPSELPLEDLRAAEPVPDGVKYALSRRPLDIFIGDRRATPAELCTALQRSDELVLPDGFSTKLAAAPNIIDIADGASGEPIATDALPGYRPPWVDLVYHPRSMSPREAPYLRTVNGTLVQPDAKIWGRDDRHVLGPYQYPWHCIGKLRISYNDSSGHGWVNSGTAALVGRRTILTAQHIMPGRGLFQPQPPAWSATFEAGKTNFDFVPVAPTAHVTQAAGYWGAKNVTSSSDMMVMQLDAPLGDHLGFLPVRAYDDSWEDQPWWTHVGYPKDKGGDAPYVQREISVVDDEVGNFQSEELYSYGDSFHGDSGGPLLGWLSTVRLFPEFSYSPPEPTIIGVRSGTTSDYTVDAGGNLLTFLSNWGRTNFD